MKNGLERIWTGRSGKRISVGSRFFSLVQTDPGLPGLIFMGTRSLPWVKRKGWALTTYPSVVPSLKSVDLHPCYPSGPHGLFSEESYIYLLSLHLPGGADRRHRDRARTAGVATEFRRGIFRIGARHFNACVCKMRLIVSARSVTKITQTRANS